MNLSNPSLLAFVLLGGILLLALLWIARLELKWRALFRGKKAATLEDALVETQKGYEALATAHRELAERHTVLAAEFPKSVRGIGTVRFNPFKGTSGSNQSFASAFIDGEGNGVVLSSIYSREHVSVFAKPLRNHDSEYGLSAEEKQAGEEARGNPKSQ